MLMISSQTFLSYYLHVLILMMIQLHEENNPGGYRGEYLEHIGQRLGGLIQLSVGAVQMPGSSEHEQPIAPDRSATLMAQRVEFVVNAVGQMYRSVREVYDRVTAMTPEEFVQAKPRLEEIAPTYDWEGFYERNRPREPGKMGRLWAFLVSRA